VLESVAVHEKPYLAVAFHEPRTREFGGEPGGPSLLRKNEFRIDGDAISRCFDGLTCTLQSLLIVDIIPRSHFTHPHYMYFYADLDKLL